MMDTLRYTIAGFTVDFSVPDASMARTLLQSHEPFLSSSSEGTPLYTIHSVESIQLPPREYLIDEDEEAGFHSWMYVYEGNSYIEYILGDQKAILMWDAAMHHFYTDITFAHRDELPNIRALTNTAFAVASAPYRTLKVHASVIELDGRALLFLGVSGTGKSTHSRLWLDNVQGATLLNDDSPIVRVHDDGSVLVYGAPWSGSTSCYRNESAKVVAFVHLYQYPENVLTQESDLEALSSLLLSSSAIRKDRANKNYVFSTISDILSTTPVYKLRCRPDIGALNLTLSLL